MKLTPEISSRIANVSLVAALAVVCIHLPIGAGSDLSATGLFRSFVSRGMCRAAVPFFMLVSGFLLAGHVDEPGWWRDAVVKRWRSLLVPYLVWSMLFSLSLLLGCALPELMHGRDFDFVSWLSEKRWQIFGLDLLDTPLLLPLWYLRTLMLLVVASPLLVAGVRVCRMTTLGALFAVYVVFAWAAEARHDLFDHLPFLAVVRQTLHPESIFYFTLGLGLRLDPRAVNFSRRTGMFSLVVAFVLLGVRISLVGSSLAWCVPYPLIIPLVLIALWSLVPSRPWPRALVSLSFPIYLLHYFVTHGLSQVAAMRSSSLIPVGVAFVAATAFSVGVTVLMRRMVPMTTNILFGGR